MVYKKKRGLSPDEAANVIQRSFRSFINVRIYQYYRSLINFRNRGDPSLLLKSINPSEAALVQDRASGAVVRFRLGGSVFPPVVYYKIFVRAPVTDLGSFAPRDYTAGRPNQFYLLQRHNDALMDDSRQETMKDVTAQVDRGGWYKRFENNGWRPIANKLLFNVDPVTARTADQKKPDFHHSCTTRKHLAHAKRLKKKKEWMSRMYRPKGESHNAKGEEEGENEEEEEGVEDEDDLREDFDMVTWAHSLDYEDYMENWTSLATSLTVHDMRQEL
ncbi:hypothetical protein GUITHDRAFT_164511 [Guillardia theta CCMP2712]|uniref:Uncharacterized protein n=1 Tax=Guillardia theta (strain CCMP2712) TaxID=905079 RepID=L1IXI3_GUITC|nr:hypothetical protein GUITHDRAFT_164511 [Guillardia theta CCMP2712]EKX40941.1 hypothetical protein GUITHDRAFT_164511 [Guillardia theta CCMP2712]|mmetsp:Transcript_47387/g.148230  ORF Transcript_47387/g.148230 Transcript_47387/m.148230 type:complete len:274 (-) Transcript_47387:935-1756(-)|eukprot:XP_005827921.1 hypothetical protein GUITHDRAFT_164511 [Guillardia theta CCMP2712]